MNPRLEIFSQGEEIVTGQTIDSNAAWLSQQAMQQGFTVTRHTAVGDQLEDLITLLKEIACRADCCICTGGLGPTIDDLTTDAVSKAFSVPLEFDAIAFAKMQHYFSDRNKTMPITNRKQAMLPKGSERLNNDWGTAAGFTLQHQNCWFVFLPGVPSEMKPMFLTSVLPHFSLRFDLKPRTLITLKTVGIGESDIQQKISSVTIPKAIQLGFRASLNEVQTKLLFPYNYDELAMTSLIHRMAALLGDAVFAIDKSGSETTDLFSVVNSLMIEQQQTLAIIETISQGMIASLCIGSSWLLESQYKRTISNDTHNNEKHNDFNELKSTANILATSIRKNSGANLALIQLYTSVDANKDIIIVYHILHTANNCIYEQHTLAGSTKRKQQQSALLALDFLRRNLQNNILH